MKKLMIALATAGLFSGAGTVLACDQYQQDASTDATPMMSKGAPVVVACDGSCNKPDPTAVKSKTKATTKTAVKAKAKPDPMASL